MLASPRPLAAVVQAKRNDPWAVLNRDDSESYAREAIEGRADWRKQQARFRSTLDGQVRLSSFTGQAPTTERAPTALNGWAGKSL